MKRYTITEWRAEFDRRGADEPDLVGFRCPNCGSVSSPLSFVEAGTDGKRAARECIGRAMPEAGCDWAAFGLLGTMERGVEVIYSDGHSIEAFDFAEPSS